MANAEIVNKDNFEQEVLKADKLVLVDFFAPWCGHCTKLLPLIDELSGDMEGKVKVCKVNVDENRDLAQKYEVKGLPTMVVFKSGAECDRLIGFMPKEKIAEKLSAKL